MIDLARKKVEGYDLGYRASHIACIKHVTSITGMSRDKRIICSKYITSITSTINIITPITSITDIIGIISIQFN